LVFLQESKTGQKTLCIPEQYARLLGWKKRTELVLIPQDRGLLIKEMPK